MQGFGAGMKYMSGIVDELQKATDEAVAIHDPAVRPTVRLQHGFVPVIIIFYSLEC